MVQTIGIAIATVGAAALFHQNLLDRIVKAPMAFFDTTPTGRILNRFSQDMAIIDSNIRMTLVSFLRGISGLLTTIVAISYTAPIFVAFLVPLSVLYYFVWVRCILLCLKTYIK